MSGLLSRAKLIAIVFTVACLACAAATLRLSEATPESQQLRAAIGEQVDTEMGWIRIDSVRIGDQLTDNGAVSAQTPGAFVAVELTVGATGFDDDGIGTFQLVTRDRTYARWRGGLATADPGFQVTSQQIFEVDPTDIDDLTLEAWHTEVVSGYQQHVVVHLGITPGNAHRWRDSARGQAIRLRDTDTRALP